MLFMFTRAVQTVCEQKGVRVHTCVLAGVFHCCSSVQFAGFQTPDFRDSFDHALGKKANLGHK